MVKNSLNWNVAIIAAAALGGLYLWNKAKTSNAGNIATGYTSGTTGEYISEATQPTIRTDLRQAARTQRTFIRNPVASDYTSGTTGENISAASQPTIRTDIRRAASVSKTEIRQDARTERQENRIAARQQTRPILGGLINNIQTLGKNKVIQRTASLIRTRLRRA